MRGEPIVCGIDGLVLHNRGKLTIGGVVSGVSAGQAQQAFASIIEAAARDATAAVCRPI